MNNDTLYEQVNYRGYSINIYYDYEAENPRDWSNLGILYTAHPRYCPEKQFKDHFQQEKVFDEQMNFLLSFNEKYIALKVYLYDHGGITISTLPFSCPWDSGLFGIIVIEKEKAKEEYSWKRITRERRKMIENTLIGEIQLLDEYYRGNTFGYTITKESNVIDSCWGYLGNDSIKVIKEECEAYINSFAA